MIDLDLGNSHFLLVTLFLFVILNLFMAVVVFKGGKKEKSSQFLALIIIAITFWTVFNCLSNIANDVYLSLIFKRMNLGFVCLFFIVAYFFSIYFPRPFKKISLTHGKIVVAIWSILFFVTIFTNKIIQYKIEGWSYGDGATSFYIIVFFFTILILFNLIRKYSSLVPREKLKVQYFLVGSILLASFSLIFNVFFPVVLNEKEYWYLGDYSAIFLFGFTAYAIVKHELMGIKTLLTQVLIVIISIILLIDVILLSDDLVMQLLKICILLIFLYFSRGMVESVRNEKKAREELERTYKKINTYIKQLKSTNINLKEKNEDLGALLKISDVVVGTLNSRKIAQGLVNSIPINLGHLKYKGGILILYDRKKEIVYPYTLTESGFVEKAKKILSKSLTEYEEKIDKLDNFVAKTIKTREMQIGDKLEDFIAPVVNKKTCKLIQKIVKAKSFISIPIFSGGRVTGTVVFVGTKPKSGITQRDKDILSGFSSHIGATIENAKLYEQTEKQIEALSILNENLKMANVRLKELMEIKNEFLHITSHQLRTPLTTIRGMIAMWYSGDFDDLPEEEKKKMLKRIYISSERLNNITNDMLDSLELEGGFMKFQFKQESLKEIIKETVDIMRPNFDEKNLFVKFNNSVNVPKVAVEPNYIRQVFMNTIDNACKYTRKGGVDINIKKAGEYVEIIIKDTGIGVSKRDQKKIFLKFTRGRRASIENASGSGLGLFIAKKIVDAHNGKIEFFSEGTGKGSVVKIFLLIKQK